MTALFLLLSTLTAVVTGKNRNHMKLELVQVIWRHGDRKAEWTSGEVGWEQLSTIGMKQHFEFGKQLRKRYIDSHFLSKTYNSKEIYVRSSDYNRTIISAMANLMGMYSYKNSASRNCPPGFVTIAVHDSECKTDFVAIAHAACKRKDWLIEMLKKGSGECKALFNDLAEREIFAKASASTGGDYSERNVWNIMGVWKIKQVQAQEKPNKCGLYSVKFFQTIDASNSKLVNYDNGIFDCQVRMNGLDIGREIKKLRGGSLTNDINMHMHLKSSCLNKDSEPQCRWISGLKYYVYSAHDTTVFALLSALGISQQVVYKGRYREYTAAVFIELYTNANNNLSYFKLLYRTSDVEDTIFHTITHHIPGCNKSYCKLSVFEQYAKVVQPDRDMVKWCEVDTAQEKQEQQKSTPEAASETSSSPSTTATNQEEDQVNTSSETTLSKPFSSPSTAHGSVD